MPDAVLHVSAPPLTLAELVNEAQRLQQAGRTEAAVALYQQWLQDGPVALRHVAFFNLGTLLGALQRPAEAEAAYRGAVALQPDFPHARLNLGHLLERAGAHEAALAEWRAVIAANPAVDLKVHAWNNIGRLLEQLRRYPEAEAALKDSLVLDPAQPSVIQHYVHLRQKQCAWPVYAPVGTVGPNRLLQGTSLLAMMGLSDDPALQLLSAVRFANDRVPKGAAVPLHKTMPPRTGKIKVFEGQEIGPEALMASACLPTVFQTVQIGGEGYWDGGYSGNPALFPLYEPDLPDDILVVSINPMRTDDIPDTPLEIQNRINEISFNASLLSELRAINFVRRLIAEGRMEAGKMKAVNVHMIADDGLMNELSAETKLAPTPYLLERLKAAGLAAAERFLQDGGSKIGQEPSADLRGLLG